MIYKRTKRSFTFRNPEVHPIFYRPSKHLLSFIEKKRTTQSAVVYQYLQTLLQVNQEPSEPVIQKMDIVKVESNAIKSIVIGNEGFTNVAAAIEHIKKIENEGQRADIVQKLKDLIMPSMDEYMYGIEQLVDYVKESGVWKVLFKTEKYFNEE